MNIFVTSEDPIKCAQNLDSRRLIKMVLETSQLLSSALRLHGYTGEVYKISHKNHPSSIWARATRGNYLWLLDHFTALCNEYTRRRGKVHASQALLPHFIENGYLIPPGERTAFSNNARNLSKGVDYTHIEDVPLAYQLYLSKRWETDKHEPVWD